MRASFTFCFLLFATIGANSAAAQSQKAFPSADTMLKDAKHKEPKSGVQLGPGNTLTIQSGVGTPTTINVLSFSKDGILLAAGKDFGRVVVWNVHDRKFVCAAEGDQRIVHAVAISPDGQTLASAGEGDNFSLKLWRLPDCQLLKRYDSFGGYIRSLAFGPNGAWLVALDNTGTTRVLDPSTGKQLLELKNEHSPVLSSDGSVLLTVNEAEFNLRDTSDWTKQRSWTRTPKTAVPLALDLKSDAFLFALRDGFQLARLSTGAPIEHVPAQPLPKFNGAVDAFAAFSIGVPNIVFGHSSGRLWAWNVQTGQTCVSEVLYSESGALSPDGSILAGAKDNSILAPSGSPNGVWLWDSRRLIAKCAIGPQ